MPSLRFAQGLRLGEIVSLGGKSEFLIGRDPACDLVLQEAAVSRQHCMIKRLGEQYFAVSLGSRAGIRVNNTPWGGEEQVLLAEGDQIGICSSVLVFSTQ